MIVWYHMCVDIICFKIQISHEALHFSVPLCCTVAYFSLWYRLQMVYSIYLFLLVSSLISVSWLSSAPGCRPLWLSPCSCLVPNPTMQYVSLKIWFSWWSHSHSIRKVWDLRNLNVWMSDSLLFSVFPFSQMSHCCVFPNIKANLASHLHCQHKLHNPFCWKWTTSLSYELTPSLKF